LNPVLRWVGGKRFLATKLAAKVPSLPVGQTYFEPFLGAGTLFFKLCPLQSVISDLNPALVNFYEALRSSPKELYSLFCPLTQQHSTENYYQVRSKYNQEMQVLPKASMFLYLNLTNFNGVHRVNRLGKYNVPVGKPTRTNWPTQDELLAASEVLRNSQIRFCDFTCALDEATSGDFAFFDPPYPALSPTAFFQHYTLERFNEEGQIRLASVWKDLDRRGVRLLMTNADTDYIRKLYGGYHVSQERVPRPVNCKVAKISASELIISNYD
jgi:DNA adenine methylase